MPSTRRSIHISGVDHGRTPIPMGCRVANLVFSSAIPGTDPSTGDVPADPDRQVELAFSNLACFLAAADVGLDDLAHLTVLIADDALRPVVDKHWLRLFPDPDSRPARHAVVGPLRGDIHIQLEAIAVLAADAH